MGGRGFDVACATLVARTLDAAALGGRTIKEAVYGPDHPDVASTLVNLGVVQLELGEFEAARAPCSAC